MKRKFNLNELSYDEYGRVDGVLAINKPAGITSHDVVDIIRGRLGTRKVGHAGTLDPFATGVLVVLVGKATKVSEEYMATDKEYVATVLFGLKTDSGDIEGEVTQQSSNPSLSGLIESIEKFQPSYEQYVSLFSSVKVGGDKLRVLVREYPNYEIQRYPDNRTVIFKNSQNQEVKSLEIPKHHCNIPYIGILSTGEQDISEMDFYKNNIQRIDRTIYPTAQLRVACSKGTYIRVLAEDIGEAMANPMPTMLIALQRSRVGSTTISDCIDLDHVELPPKSSTI